MTATSYIQSTWASWRAGGRRSWLFAGTAGAVALAVVTLASLGSSSGGDMGYLFTDLDPAAAKSVTDRLTQSGVEWKLSPDGTSVMVPTERLAALRMELAGEDMAGPVGYGVIDAESPLGMSDQRASLNQIRAIEGELARSITTINAVQRARVHLALPERSLFAREGRQATASVTLRTRSPLSKQSVNAIRALVAGSVQELSPERVTIVDQHGRLLTGAGDLGGMLDERQAEIEDRLRVQVEELLERAVGAGRVRVQVAAEVSRTSRRDENEKFDPDGQVVASQTTVDTQGTSREGDTATAASISTELPQAQGQAAPGGTAQTRAANNREVSEETAFNNSRLRSTTVEEAGRLTRTTVSVLLDTKTASGRALTQDDVRRLGRLVENAVGYDAARGDRVAIELVPMERPANLAEDAAEPSGIPPWAWALAAVAALAVAVAAWVFLRRRRAAGARAIAAAEIALLPAADGTPGTALIDARPVLSVEEETEERRRRSIEARERMDQMLHELVNAVSANPQGAVAIVKNMLNR